MAICEGCRKRFRQKIVFDHASAGIEMMVKNPDIEPEEAVKSLVVYSWELSLALGWLGMFQEHPDDHKEIYNEARPWPCQQ